MGAGATIGLLPYAVLSLLVAAARARTATWGEAIVRAAVVFGVLVVAGTEILSAATAIARGPVAGLWLLAGTIAAAAAWRSRRRAQPPAAVAGGDPAAAVAGAAVVLALGTTFLVGLVAAPNSWDGMTYHLPRVVHWMTGHSVRPFATSIDRQLWMNPWTEWLNLHVMVLAGGSDRFVALPAWLALAGCVALAAALARRLGTGRRGALLAALLVATAPTAVVQATGTKTELVGAFWILATAVCALDAARGALRGAALRAGLAAGLALATKGTGLVFALPWLVVLAVAIGRRAGGGALLRAAAVVAAAVLLPNAGIFARNVAVYGDPLGDPVTRRFLAVDTLDPPFVVSNLVTTATLHLATPWTAPNDVLASVVDGLHRAILGQPVAVLHPYLGGFRVSTSQSHEAVAPSLVLFVLGLAASLAVWVSGRSRPGLARAAALATWGGFLLFGVSIRWQPYGGRLLLPMLACLAPVAAAVVDPLARGWRGIGLAALCLALAVPALWWNDTRPLLPWSSGILARPRADGYVAGREAIAAPYRRLLADLTAAGCDRVALAAGYDSAEYPLWALGRLAGQDRTFEHVLVENPSARFEAPRDADHCALVAVDRPAAWRPDGPWAGARLRWREGAVSLWALPGAAS